MGEGEMNFIVGEMREGFRTVREDIRASRTERHQQISALHGRVNDIAQNGCAHREAHEREFENLRKALERRNAPVWGVISTKNLKATGIAALILALAIGFAIAKTCNWL